MQRSATPVRPPPPANTLPPTPSRPARTHAPHARTSRTIGIGRDRARGADAARCLGRGRRRRARAGGRTAREPSPSARAEKRELKKKKKNGERRGGDAVKGSKRFAHARSFGPFTPVDSLTPRLPPAPRHPRRVPCSSKAVCFCAFVLLCFCAFGRRRHARTTVPPRIRPG